MRKLLALLVITLFLLSIVAVAVAAEPTSSTTTTTTTSTSLSASTAPADTAVKEQEREQEREKEREKDHEKQKEEKKLKLKLRDEEEEEDENESEGTDAAKKEERLQKVRAELDKAMQVLAENPSSIKAKEAVLRAHLRVEAMLQNGENWAAALKLAQAILAEDPTNEVATLVQAKDLYDQGKVEDALKLLQDFVAKNPQDKDEAEEKLGELLEEMGDLQGAKKALEESVQLNPASKKTYEKLGRILEKQGEKGLKVFVGGKRPDFDVLPQIIDGRTMVPFRKVGEVLGAKIDWREETRTVLAERNGIKVELPIGSLTIYINGKPQTIDVPAQIVNGRTLVPVRFLSQALGATVDWNPTYQIVIVIDGQPAPATTTQ